MNRGVRILIYFALVVFALAFGGRFYVDYTQLMQDNSQAVSAEAPGKAASGRKIETTSAPLSRLITFGGLCFASVVGLSLLLAHDISHYVAAKALKVVFDEDVRVETDPEYEMAEQEWANGHHLEAIRLMRDYLKKKPREIHALIRIAEIYEKDLNNPLAAALEYEEVLRHKLRPERWGWAAIHLCNLYTSKLQKREQAVALLRRIEAECGDTPPAEKARKRLAMLDGEASESGSTEDASDENPPARPA